MSNVLTLKNAKISKKYSIADCLLSPDVKARFSEMGMVKGTVVTVLKKAPLGDPIEIRVRGYSLCIRAAEAEYFIVRATDEQD